MTRHKDGSDDYEKLMSQVIRYFNAADSCGAIVIGVAKTVLSIRTLFRLALVADAELQQFIVWLTKPHSEIVIVLADVVFVTVYTNSIYFLPLESMPRDIDASVTVTPDVISDSNL